MLLMCFCHTIAARYGALAGFGLSLAKWTLIVKRSTDLVRDENAWLWWLVLAFGFLICIRCAQHSIVTKLWKLIQSFAFRAMVQFRQIKRSWPHLSTQARERLFFFYWRPFQAFRQDSCWFVAFQSLEHHDDSLQLIKYLPVLSFERRDEQWQSHKS